MFSNAVSCYGFEMLATSPTNKLEAPLIGCPLPRTIRVCWPSPSHPESSHTVMTRKHLVRLMIHSSYHDRFYHRLVFLVALTVLRKKFIPQPYLTSIINVLLSLSIIYIVLIFILLLTFSDIQSLMGSLLTSSHDEIKYITLKTRRECYTKL